MRWSRAILLAVGLLPLLMVGWHRTRPSIAAVGFAPDGRSLATVVWRSWPRDTAGIELRVWDLATGRERRGDRRWLPDPLLVIVADERLVVRRGDGSTDPLTSLARWPERTMLDGRYGLGGCDAAISQDGRTLATANHRADGLAPRDQDTRVRLWDVATGRLVRTLDDGKALETLAFTPDGRIIVGVGGLRLVAWEVESGRLLAWPQTTGPTFAPLAVAPDGSSLAVGGIGGKLHVLDLADGHVVASFPRLQASALAFRPDGRRLAVANDEPVPVFDLASGREVARFPGHARPRSSGQRSGRRTVNSPGCRIGRE